jgi:hypothetical protein
LAGSDSEGARENDGGGAQRLHLWTRRILGSLGGLLLATGVLGAAISAYFQQRNWTYQKRADKIDRDAAAAMAALDGLNKIVDEKFLSTYGLDDAIKSRTGGDKLDAAVARFYAADKAWERQHQSLASTLEIVIDSQFGIDDLHATAQARKADCARYAFDGLQSGKGDPLPVRAVLEVLYTCQTKLKQSIETQLKARDDNGGAWPAAIVEPDPGRIALGHVWRVQNVLQCLMVQRAVEIRGQPFGASLMPFGDSERAAPYTISESDRAREERCIEPYRSDPTFGAAAAKPT